jgi:hypothetical protein
MWKEKVNSEEFKAEIMEGLNSLQRRDLRLNGHWKYWQRRESYLPKIRMRLIDIPRGLYPIIYKDLVKREMAIAYESNGIVFDAEISNLDFDLNFKLPYMHNVYYLAVYSEKEHEIIHTSLYPKNRRHVYIVCGFLARCMPRDVFNVVWGALKKFAIV